jgi:DNA-directed RNA polymerase subunit RPC12/RpoP
MIAPGIEVAGVFRRFLDAYLKRHGQPRVPEQRRAIADILGCMTEQMGGKRYRCSDCGESFWQYHGCRNRSCPKCHGRQILEWIEARSAELLPCDYFHVVTTVPAELRPIFRAEQKYMYALLMKVSAGALCELAGDRRYLGAVPAIMSVLHTWTGQMLEHPHVHMLVSGGGVTADGKSWSAGNPNFLMPVKKLSPLVARRFREALSKQRPDLYAAVPAKAWKRQWCSFCKPVGEGRDALVRYLARYVYRVAINRHRILTMDESHVTFKLKRHDTGEWKIVRITGVEFIRRFLLHVLPRGFHKVRYYGLWHSSKRQLMKRARVLLRLCGKLHQEQPVETIASLAAEALPGCDIHSPAITCPNCGSLNLQLVEELRKGARVQPRR